MLPDAELGARARSLAAALEPVAGQVYFSPECHQAYVDLGFSPSPARTSEGVQVPDATAYFTSRGSVMGQVPGEVVAAAFAVFNPDVVVPLVTTGWQRTDASTICAARTDGAVAQLARVLGRRAGRRERARELLLRASDPLRPEGRPMYAGLRSLGLPGSPLADVWRAADRLREYRGDAHTATWTSAGFDATEIGLLTELYWGLPMGTYVRTRAWSDEQLDAAKERLRSRDLLDGDGFSSEGRIQREKVEAATDDQCRPALDALGDDLEELLTILRPWGKAIRDAGGYLPGGPHDLAGAGQRVRPDELEHRGRIRAFADQRRIGGIDTTSSDATQLHAVAADRRDRLGLGLEPPGIAPSGRPGRTQPGPSARDRRVRRHTAGFARPTVQHAGVGRWAPTSRAPPPPRHRYGSTSRPGGSWPSCGRTIRRPPT